jgi:hypothetical protein
MVQRMPVIRLNIIYVEVEFSLALNFCDVK